MLGECLTLLYRHKNEPVKCYGFIMGYYRGSIHTLRNAKRHATSSQLGKI